MFLRVLAAGYCGARRVADRLKDERGASYVDYAAIAGISLLLGVFVYTTVLPAIKNYLTNQVVNPLGTIK